MCLCHDEDRKRPIARATQPPVECRWDAYPGTHRRWDTSRWTWCITVARAHRVSTPTRSRWWTSERSDATGWSERVAVLGRGQRAMEEGFRRIQGRVPFTIKELHPD